MLKVSLSPDPGLIGAQAISSVSGDLLETRNVLSLSRLSLSIEAALSGAGCRAVRDPVPCRSRTARGSVPLWRKFRRRRRTTLKVRIAEVWRRSLKDRGAEQDSGNDLAHQARLAHFARQPAPGERQQHDHGYPHQKKCQRISCSNDLTCDHPLHPDYWSRKKPPYFAVNREWSDCVRRESPRAGFDGI
jgi:hypothetical protein